MKQLATILLLLIAPLAQAICSERAQIVVAADGSGNFRSIQHALNSIPRDNSRNVIILVKNGTYHEKVYVDKSFVTLVGEDRDSTRTIFAELRENWNKDHQGSDWGSAVINIDSTVTNLTLANLTVHNNYGSLHGVHGHQFAVWGEGTRIIFLNCNMIADGGDTVSLWNRRDGMYYHANCSFEGWVDYVCPRGWCYITDSRFYGHNLSASIWHDGSAQKDQKLVIRNSFFDGVPGFPLGRHHRDAQIYLLDCIFSREMADRPIYSPRSPNTIPWIWGERHYFCNCHRIGGDFRWFADNLASAEGFPTDDQITARWTFGGRWDPENEMPSVLPRVSMPNPRDGSYDIPIEAVLVRWLPSRNAESCVVYFGSQNNPPHICTQVGREFRPGKLEPKTRYFWRIDEIAGSDTLRGPVWHFTTVD
jgi:pectinesterase